MISQPPNIVVSFGQVLTALSWVIGRGYEQAGSLHLTGSPEEEFYV
jgi:hypothetical protein